VILPCVQELRTDLKERKSEQENGRGGLRKGQEREVPDTGEGLGGGVAKSQKKTSNYGSEGKKPEKISTGEIVREELQKKHSKRGRKLGGKGR